jgi:SAM-dependent methyltransferase
LRQSGLSTAVRTVANMPGIRIVGAPLLRAAVSLRDVAVDLGAMSYRPRVRSDQEWHEKYAEGTWDFMGEIYELARYSILIGYLGFFGNKPDVLDLGCGKGLFRERLPSEAFGSYTGVDPAASAIEEAYRLTDERTRFLVGDQRTEGLGSFDVVVCNEVFSVVPSAAEALDFVIERLPPGGLCLTSIWHHPGDKQLWRLINSRLELIDRVWVTNPSHPRGSRGWWVACHRRL